MKKLIVVVVVLVLMLFACAMAEQVDTGRVLDNISYFSEEELMLLEERIAQFEEATGVVLWVEMSDKAKRADDMEAVTKEDLLELLEEMDELPRIAVILNIGLNINSSYHMSFGPPGTLDAFFSNGYKKAVVQIQLGKVIDGVLAYLDSAEELLLAAE